MKKETPKAKPYMLNTSVGHGLMGQKPPGGKPAQPIQRLPDQYVREDMPDEGNR